MQAPLPTPKSVWENFNVQAVSDFGYIAEHHDGRWYLRVWANQGILKDDCLGHIHINPARPCSYLLLLSIRDTQSGAEKDGHRWMAQARKRLIKAHREMQ